MSFLNPARTTRVVLGRVWCSTKTEQEMSMRTILLSHFKADDVQVTDISGGCGSMFRIQVVSSLFEGQGKVAQHRLVNEVLKKEIGEMHGLTVSFF